MIRRLVANAYAAVLLLLLLCVGAALASPAVSAQETKAPKDPEQEKLPLEVGRHLRYTATEGSWISLDVSPDGRRIVFDHLGDIFTVPMEGGRATRITRGMGFDTQPRYSPDGTHIVFTSDRDGGENLWIVATDLSDTVQVTKGKHDAYVSPEWTPDGQYVIASKDGKLHLWHRTGGAGVQVVKEPGNLRTVGGAFGTDPRYVWLSAYPREGSLYNSGMKLYQLAVYDRETGTLSMRSDRWGGGFQPTLSPDGKWVVYGSRHVADTGLRIRDLATGEEHWLAYPVQRDDQESSAQRDVYPGMSFTPDSKEVVATYGGKIWRVPVDGSDPVEVPFQVDVDLPIGPDVHFEYDVPDSATFVAKQIRNAVPSPDGARLTFTVMDDLYVMDWPDGTPGRLAEGLEAVQQHPAWSPDGQWIAFSAWTDAEGGSLYRVRANGQGSAERLTQASALYLEPRWSPDGARILAERAWDRDYEEALQRGNLGEPTDLVWIPAAGGTVTRVMPSGDLTGFHFTHDAARIWAFSPEDGLVSFRWDGTDRKAYVKVRGPTASGGKEGQNATLILMAPEGDQALVQVVNDLYVVTVPYVGGDTPTLSVEKPENAAFPARKLTEIGGQFPAWSDDGRKVHWSIGNAHVVYDLDAARAFDDSVKVAARAGAGDAGGAGGAQASDTTAAGDAKKKAARFEPFERRVRIAYERDIPQGVAVLRGARIVTMRGDEVIEDGDIVVRNNRIVDVGARGSVTVPAGAEVIDVSGKTIVPGFVDVHAHLRAAYEFHRTQPWSYAANLAYGVTTSRDPQTGTTDILTYEDEVRSGRMLGPRLYSTGPGVFSSENIQSLDHARDVLTRYSGYYDTKTIKMYGAGNREQRQWIVQAARELRLMPTTEGSLDLEDNLTMAQDGYSGVEHNFPGMPHYDDLVHLLVASRTSNTPTMLVTYGGPWAENYFYSRENPFENAKLRTFTPFEDVQQRTLRRPGPTGAGSNGWFQENQYPFPLIADFEDRVVKAGGLSGIGGHGQLQGLGYHWEMWAFGSGRNVTPHDVLRVATIIGAASIGLDDELGSLEPGKLADLVILDGNPLTDLRQTDSVDRIMKNGRLYDGDTLDEVWPRRRKAGPFYWQKDPAKPDTRAGIR